MRSWIYRIIGAVLAIGVIFVALNFGFFRSQFNYMFGTHFGQNDTRQSLQEDTAETSEPNLLEIPALGINAPLLYTTEPTEENYQKLLQDGVVHFPDTAQPGQAGNAYFFGHSSDFAWTKGNYKTVFALLPHIKIGELIYITDQEGKLFKYKAVSTIVVSPQDTSVLDQQNFEKKLLSLQTSYPVGTALKRFVVVAELVEE